MPHLSPSSTGRFPSEISQRILVDPFAARLDNFVYHLVAATLEEALRFAAANPVDTDRRGVGTGRNGWTIELRPGEHLVDRPLAFGLHNSVVGHQSAGAQGQGADVVIRITKDVDQGDILTLQASTLSNVQILWDAPDGAAGGNLASEAAILAVDTAAGPTRSCLENVQVRVNVNGAANVAHPIRLLKHLNAEEKESLLELQGCKFSVTHDREPHPDSRYALLHTVGKADARATIADTVFEAGAYPMTECVEVTGDSFLDYVRCDFAGWPGKLFHHQDGTGANVRTRSTRYDGKASQTNGPSVLVDHTFNPAATSSTDPGVEGEVRFTATGTAQQYINGLWRRSSNAPRLVSRPLANVPKMHVRGLNPGGRDFIVWVIDATDPNALVAVIYEGEPFLSGDVTVTASSATVTGINTSFLKEAVPAGRYFYYNASLADRIIVATVEQDDSMTVAPVPGISNDTRLARELFTTGTTVTLYPGLQPGKTWTPVVTHENVTLGTAEIWIEAPLGATISGPVPPLPLMPLTGSVTSEGDTIAGAGTAFLQDLAPGSLLYLNPPLSFQVAVIRVDTNDVAEIAHPDGWMATYSGAGVAIRWAVTKEDCSWETIP